MRLAILSADQHVKVYYQPGRFGGWPANHGIWAWGNEILVGFSAGDYKDLGLERHNIDRDKPESHLLARSLDGGETLAHRGSIARRRAAAGRQDAPRHRTAGRG